MCIKERAAAALEVKQQHFLVSSSASLHLTSSSTSSVLVCAWAEGPAQEVQLWGSAQQWFCEALLHLFHLWKWSTIPVSLLHMQKSITNCTMTLGKHNFLVLFILLHVLGYLLIASLLCLVQEWRHLGIFLSHTAFLVIGSGEDWRCIRCKFWTSHDSQRWVS